MAGLFDSMKRDMNRWFKVTYGYEKGTTYVPQTKKYLLHKGEMVIPKKEATILRKVIAEKKKKAPVKKAPVKKTKDKKKK